jgi:hypothetical protein
MKGEGATDLSDCSTSNRFLIKLFKHFVKRPLEDTFYDTLCMCKRMRSSLRMHLAHTFTQQSGKQICTRGCPLSKLPVDDGVINQMLNISTILRTLIKVGPARSIWATKYSYHQTAPHLSPCSLSSGDPTSSMGDERMTGKRRKNKRTNRLAVRIGSQMCSTKRIHIRSDGER